MSEESEVIRQTLQLCHQINQKCQIDHNAFNYQILQTKKWYTEILQILCPYLVDQLAIANRQKDQGKAIDIILQLINSLDEFNQDVTQAIKGENIVSGDPVQIYYIVQVFAALLEQAMKQQEYGQEQAQIQKQESNQPQKNPFSNFLGNKNSGTKSQQDQKSEKQGHHSVIGIQHQFEESGNSERESDFEADKKQMHGKLSNQNKSEQNQGNTGQPFHHKNEPQQSQNSNQNYLSQKLSQTKMNKKHKKNPQNKQISKKKKILIAHPKIPQRLQKAKSAQAIRLTKQVQKSIKSPKKHPKIITTKMQSPTSQTLKKKKKQLQYYQNDYKTHKKQLFRKQKNRKQEQAKTSANFNKLLNWRQEKLKKQQKQYEQSLKMKLQNQKQLYVKKLNKVVLKMEKQKVVDEKKQFKEKLIEENNKAVKRLAALQQFYQDRLAILRQNKHQNRLQRNLISTGHKEIITQIQKQLKKQNEQKMIKLTEKYRKQSEFIQNDLEELEKKIIKVYQKN